MSDTDDRAPWIPESMRLPRVGNRVRVRLSNECPVSQTVVALFNRADTFDLERHPEPLDGGIGTVERILEDDDHGWIVRFDAPIWFRRGYRLSAGMFAAAELVLLDEP